MVNPRDIAGERGRRRRNLVRKAFSAKFKATEWLDRRERGGGGGGMGIKGDAETVGGGGGGEGDGAFIQSAAPEENAFPLGQRRACR